MVQLRVGIFAAVGLAAIGLMVVYFGRFGDSLRGSYTLTVEYPNASGIYKGANVLLAGAKVGIVNTPPVILPEMNGVSIDLKIYEDVEIPSKSEFTIGSSGLLGDRFVEIVLGKGAKDSAPIAPGATIKGRGESGMGDMFEKAGSMIPDIQAAIGRINEIAEKLNAEVLNEQSVANINATIENLKQTSAAFAESSKKLDGVVAKVDGVVQKADGVMAKADTVLTNTDGAVQTGRDALASAKKSADTLTATLNDIRDLLRQAKQGRGAVGALLADREMAENLKRLVANLRQHGILWYKDRPPEPANRR